MWNWGGCSTEEEAVEEGSLWTSATNSEAPSKKSEGVSSPKSKASYRPVPDEANVWGYCANASLLPSNGHYYWIHYNRIIICRQRYYNWWFIILGSDVYLMMSKFIKKVNTFTVVKNYSITPVMLNATFVIWSLCGVWILLRLSDRATEFAIDGH